MGGEGRGGWQGLVHIYIYIILLLFILRARFNWSGFCTSDAFHIRIRDRSEQVCVCNI